MDRAAARIAVGERARLPQPLPAVRAHVGELHDRQALACAHPSPTAWSISPKSSSLIPALTRVGTGPKSPSAAFPPAA